ncbi:MAG: multiheme c-type cytochrome [Bacteroidales bacterium]
MKRVSFRMLLTAVFILSAASMIFLSGCAKDGADGINGTNGTNGAAGLNGLDANTSCKKCHTTSVWDTVVTQYKNSKHYMGNTVSRNTKYCAKCHTSEGFLQTINNGIFTVTNDMPNANRITCETCHQHSGFDFAGDTASYVLSYKNPVFLNYNKNLVATDFGKVNNLCANCHQIRGATAFVYSDTTTNTGYTLKTNVAFTQLPYFPFAYTWASDNDTVQYLASRSFSVHDGNQSNLVAGINGYEYKGVDYSASRTWKHSSFGCADCHMNKYSSATKTGGHTMKCNEAECDACHSLPNITNVQTSVQGLLTTLGDKLVARKVMKKTTNSSGVVSYSALNTHDFNGKLYITPTPADSVTKYATSASNNTVSPTTGLVIYGNMLKYAKDTDWSLRIGRPWKYGELGAAYNYTYVNTLNALGVHNPVYAKKLLQESINWLNANKR